MYTTIRMRKKTLKRLSGIVIRLPVGLRHKVSCDDLANYLINNYSQKSTQTLDKATLRLIEMIKKSFLGAGPEDFKEYDYDDLVADCE